MGCMMWPPWSTTEATPSGRGGNPRQGEGVKAHNGDVPKDDWKERAMSGTDKPWLFVCTLLESHVN